MNVKVSKKQGVYSVFCAELVDIIAADSYLEKQYGTGECTDEDGAEYALEEFNNMLRDIIGWYKYEIKKVPDLLRTPEAFVIQFDKMAYSNCYFNHEDTQTYDVNGTLDKSSSRSNDTPKSSKSQIVGKKVYIVTETFPFFEAFTIDKKVSEKGGNTQLMLNTKTEFVVIGPKPIPKKTSNKINSLNENGANIQIIQFTDL